jgi:DNA modification methylase
MTTRILVGHVLDKLAELSDESVHCVVTSPPYYGLRDYGIEHQVWGGETACGHEWGGEAIAHRSPYGADLPNPSGGSMGAKKREGETVSQGAVCRRCNAWRGSLGLEPTPALYVEHMVEVFREVRRVLRKDGTLWLNIGDSYNAAGRIGQGTRIGYKQGTNRASANGADHTRASDPDLKEKDLLGMPWMLAFALRDDGWYLRSEITWAKRAPMPESVTDRPTSATEKVFLMAKSTRYFYDAEAVKEEADSPPSAAFRNGTAYVDQGFAPNNSTHEGRRHNGIFDQTKRNMRNWWLLGPEPFPSAHFATFPTEIPRRAILAGTSAKGVCPKCGAPWERIVDKQFASDGKSAKRGTARDVFDHRVSFGEDHGSWNVKTIGWRPSCRCAPPSETTFATFPTEIPRRAILAGTSANGVCPKCGAPWERAINRTSRDDCKLTVVGIIGEGANRGRRIASGGVGTGATSKTIGWRPACRCNASDPVPATMLDPFFGAGTTGLVADQLQRHCIGIDLNPAYAAMAERRVREDAGMFAQIEMK